MEPDYGFAFDIGQLLTFKSQLAEPPYPRPSRLLVIEQILRLSHGGTQRFYGCRIFGEYAYTSLAEFSETELLPYFPAGS